MKNSIEFWHDVCMEIVRRDFSKKPSGLPASPEQDGPTSTTRALAIAHLAMHDAYFGTTAPASTYLQKSNPPIALPAVPAPFSVDSAMAAAVAACLLATYPAQKGYIDEMAANFTDVDPNPNAKTNGAAYGKAIADSIILQRSTDRSDDSMNHKPSTAYGRHRKDPYSPGQGFLGAGWGNVKRFCAPAHIPMSDFPGKGMADFLANADYKKDFNEVKAEGALISSKRSPEETAIGLFWGYDGAHDIGVPPRLYNQIARAWLDEHRRGIVSDYVKLLAYINVGMADAAIDAWFHKYEFDLWRPVVGIREASHSTGPEAVAGPKSVATAGGALGDPFWAPLGLPVSNEPEKRAHSRTPGFPAYPSGHATFGATLFQIMQKFSGAPALTLQEVIDAETVNPVVANQSFKFESDELNGRSTDADGSVRTRHVRAFTNFARPVFENAISRVYLGVHWRFDGLPRADVPGERYGGVPLGLAVGEQAYGFFVP